MARTVEYLMQLFPDKTGKEILEIQKQDKLDDQKEFEKQHKKMLAFIEDLNTNGAYYRGKFGASQHYFYNITDLVMDEKGEVRMKVESLVIFISAERDVVSNGELHIERSKKDYEKLDTYGLEDRERVTKKEWDEVNEYLDNVTKKFW